MQSIGEVACAATSLLCAFGAKSLPAALTLRNEQTTRPPRTNRWRFIASVALVAGAFLLPAFAAQAAGVNTQTTVTQQSPNPSTPGQSVTFVVTVTAASGTTSPTGTVNFTDTFVSLGPSDSGTLSPTGTPGVSSVTFNETFGAAGTHNIIFGYIPADATFNGSSANTTQTVGTGTTTTLMSSPSTSQTGQSVTLTATVMNTTSTATPTGTVTFTQGTTTLASNVPLSGSGATVTAMTSTTALVTGTVTAQYTPTGGFIGSSGTTNQTVNNGAGTSTTLMSSPNPSTTNQSVTLTATVMNTTGTATPTGMVTFTEGTTTLGTQTLSGSGTTATATIMTTALVTGTVTASYAGVPGTFTPSSGTTNQTVNNGDGTSTTLMSSPNPSTTNQSVTLTATVMNTTGTATPTGMVTFTEGTTTLGTQTLSGSGTSATASITTTALVTGTVTASYAGVPNTFTPSSGTTIQTVNSGTTGTTTTLTSSPNPSSLGQAVTFTATVTPASGPLHPTGTVTFKDGTTVLGTGTVNVTTGVATFTTTTPLTAGSHSITAVYSGDSNFVTSTSVPLTQNVTNGNSDSIKLREMQVSTTPAIANIWGQSTAAAMDDAVSAGFGGNPQSLSPAGTGFTYYFTDDAPAQRSADTDQESLRRYLASPNGSLASPNGSGNSAANTAATDSVKRVDDDFRALSYAGGMPTKAPPAASSSAPREWLAWVTVRGNDYFRGTAGDDLKGTQVDVLAGLTRRISANFVVGAFGGYEHFDYSSQAFNGVLKGDGWTVGAYLGWKLSPNLRFDAGGAWSDIMANDTAGTASGNFTGTRWLINGGLTGTYPWQQFVFEPSARVFAIWEHENAFTDSLGTFQSARNFETGRASAGVKAIYPFAWTSSTVALSPYAGLYADYYFSQDDAQTAGLTTVPLLQGFSARATGGFAASFAGGATLGAGGEFGGIGSATHIWTWTARGRIPF